MTGHLISLEEQLKTKALLVATVVATNSDVVDAYSHDTAEEIHNALKTAADSMTKNLSRSMNNSDIRLHFHI